MRKKIITTIFSFLTFFYLQTVSAQNDEIIKMTSQEIKNLDEVYNHFEDLKGIYSKYQDRRKLFVLIYKKTTQNIHSLMLRGEVRETQWLESTIVGFAEEYRKAVYFYETNNLKYVPSPWKFDFDNSKNKTLGLATQLLLSMNSHILHDLPIVISRDVTDSSYLRRYELDFFKLNKMFSSLTPKFFEIIYKEAGQKPTYYYHPAEVIKREVVDHIVEAMRNTAWQRSLKLADIYTLNDKNDYIRYMDWHILKMGELVLELDPFLSAKPGDIFPSNVIENTWVAVTKIYESLGYEAPPTRMRNLFSQLRQY
jgi:hypothetical protein